VTAHAVCWAIVGIGCPAAAEPQAEPAAEPAPALANDTRTAGVDPLPSLVFITPESSGVVPVAMAFDALTAQIGELRARLVIAKSAPNRSFSHNLAGARALSKSHAALGAFWFEATEDGHTRIYLYEPTRERVLVRVLKNTTGPAAEEEAAVVLRAASQALLEGREVNLTPVELPLDERPSRHVPPPTTPATDRGPAPTRTKPAPAFKASRLRLEGYYLATSFAEQAPLQHGVGLGVRVRVLSVMTAGAGYAFIPPFELSAAGARARLSRHPLELYVGALFYREALWFGADVGLLADWVQRSTQIDDPDLKPLPEDTRFRAALLLRGQIGWSFNVHWGALLRGGVEWEPAPFDYVVSSPRGRAAISVPALRPRIEAGIALSLW
jgi:hypothetical protein